MHSDTSSKQHCTNTSSTFKSIETCTKCQISSITYNMLNITSFLTLKSQVYSILPNITFSNIKLSEQSKWQLFRLNMSHPTSNMIYKIFKFYLKSWNRGRCIDKNFDWNAQDSTRFTEKNSLEFYRVLERNHTRRYRRDPRYVSIQARFACSERSGRCDFETVAIKRPVNNDASCSSFHFHPSFSMSLLLAVRWHRRGEQEISSSLYCVERPRGTHAI